MQLNSELLDDFFQSGMILPRNKQFYFGGKIKQNTSVKVKFLGKEYTTQSNEHGEWKVKIAPLDTLPVNTNVIVKSENRKQVLNKVKLGQVYLLSGQSNIEFRLKDDANFEEAKKLIASGKYQDIYYYNVPQIEYIDPASHKIMPDWIKNEHWNQINIMNCGQVSDVGFWMMIQLRDQGIQEPLAVVDCFKGGTSASVWIPREKLAQNPFLNETYIKPYYRVIKNKTKQDFDIETNKYNKKVADYNQKFQKYQNSHPDLSVNAIKAKIGDMPWPPPMRPELFMRPGGLYHTMMQQLKFASFTEMIWYQGEDDRFYSDSYHELLPLLINDWREFLNDPSLPIKVIQLPGYADYPKNSGAVIRQVQLDVSKKMPYVDLVSFIDGGEEHNIHPEHKEKMGRRLGLVVSNQTYSGTPYLIAAHYENQRLVLIIGKCKEIQLKTPTCILVNSLARCQKVEISEKNIDANKIVLNEINQPISISYCDDNFPLQIGLFNEMGFPVSPFKLDF